MFERGHFMVRSSEGLGYLSPTNLNSFVKLISFGCEHVGKTLADPKLTGSHCITADTAVLLKSKHRARSSRHYISLRDVFPAGWAWLIGAAAIWHRSAIGW